MIEIELKDWTGVPISAGKREQWVREAVGELVAKKLSRVVHRSGDSLVIVEHDKEFECVNVYDVLVRRTAIVSLAESVSP